MSLFYKGLTSRMTSLSPLRTSFVQATRALSASPERANMFQRIASLSPVAQRFASVSPSRLKASARACSESSRPSRSTYITSRANYCGPILQAEASPNKHCSTSKAHNQRESRKKEREPLPRSFWNNPEFSLKLTPEMIEGFGHSIPRSMAKATKESKHSEVAEREASSSMNKPSPCERSCCRISEPCAKSACKTKSGDSANNSETNKPSPCERSCCRIREPCAKSASKTKSGDNPSHSEKNKSSLCLRPCCRIREFCLKSECKAKSGENRSHSETKKPKILISIKQPNIGRHRSTSRTNTPRSTSENATRYLNGMSKYELCQPSKGVAPEAVKNCACGPVKMVADSSRNPACTSKNASEMAPRKRTASNIARKSCTERRGESCMKAQIPVESAGPCGVGTHWLKEIRLKGTARAQSTSNRKNLQCPRIKAKVFSRRSHRIKMNVFVGRMSSKKLCTPYPSFSERLHPIPKSKHAEMMSKNMADVWREMRERIIIT